MRFLIIPLAFAIIVSAAPLRAMGSDWKEAPKPYFPPAALERNSQGAVMLRVVVTKEGTVDHVVVAKSSGNRALDEAARAGVLKWKMKRGAIKPADLSKGRNVTIDFREEAAVVARFSDGVIAGFGNRQGFNPKGAEMWRSAPFPSYPAEARARYQQGVVRLKVTIAANGDVQRVEILQSSGHHILDETALNAVRLWKAHPGPAGRRVILPIDFTRH